jgi:metallo-beta-lactamase family protein
MQISFLGASGCVTGSMYYIETNEQKGLIDCGQYQGSPIEEKLNFSKLPFDVRNLDFIILTHAHIDHTGRLPLLVKNGFKGRVFCTYPTKALTEILLRDSGKIHEADTAWDNKKRVRAGLPKVAPLYTEDDAIIASQYLYPLKYEQTFELNSHLLCRFVDAGHLLGSASVVMSFKENDVWKTITFSGDLGNNTNPLLKPTQTVDQSDYVVMESTYGDQNHEGVTSRISRLMAIVKEAFASKGTVIIPSFAIGRTQSLVFEIKEYLKQVSDDEAAVLSKIPIYIDSPLSLEAFNIYKEHLDYMRDGLTSDLFDMPQLKFVKTIEGSIALNRDTSPKVIISASGMCDAGRVLHHLKHYLWRENTHIVFIGFQAETSMGRKIQEGQSPLHILGETIAVRAQIHSISGFSGHADQDHLLKWRQQIKGVKTLFITHGEPAVSDAFAEILLMDDPNLDIIVPALDTSFTLE